MADFQPAPRKKNVFDNNKLSLRAMDKNADGKFATLNVQLVNNNPRITVWTNEQNDINSKHKGKIEGHFDIPNFHLLLEMILDAEKAEGEYREKIELKNYTWFNKQRSDAPVVQTTVVVGKTKDGIIWIGVTANNRPSFRFGLAPSEMYFNLVDQGNNPLPKSRVSSLFARGYVKMLTNLIDTVAVDEYVAPVPKEKRDGNGGNYYPNRNQGNNGGGNNYNKQNNQQASSSSDEFGDDDIPF